MNEEQLYAMRHSLAHIMAQAVQHLWPEAKFGVGPVVENGFYYDIDMVVSFLIKADSRSEVTNHPYYLGIKQVFISQWYNGLVHIVELTK